MARRLGPAAITLIVIDVVLIAVLVALVLTQPEGPDDGDPGAGATSPTEEAAPASEAPSSTQAVTVPEGAVELAEFASPSGNIWCTIADDAASCQIAEIEYEPPTIEGCDGNDLAGRVLTVTVEGAEYPCPDGDIPGAAPGDRDVLAYGDTTAVGDFMCSSSENGMSCTNLSTGATFSVTRFGPSIDNP